MDYRLDFTDEQEAIANLPMFRDEGSWVSHGGSEDVSIYGYVHVATGNQITDDDGNLVDEYILGGPFIVYLRGTLPEGLDEFVSNEPHGRTWA